jgi:hypothetical protein
MPALSHGAESCALDNRTSDNSLVEATGSVMKSFHDVGKTASRLPGPAAFLAVGSEGPQHPPQELPTNTLSTTEIVRQDGASKIRTGDPTGATPGQLYPDAIASPTAASHGSQSRHHCFAVREAAMMHVSLPRLMGLDRC